MKITPRPVLRPRSRCSRCSLGSFSARSGGCPNYPRRELVEKDQVTAGRNGPTSRRSSSAATTSSRTSCGGEGLGQARAGHARQGHRGALAGGQHQADRRGPHGSREDGGLPEGAGRPGLALAAHGRPGAVPRPQGQQGFHDLQVQLEGTENRILRAREEYNDAAARVQRRAPQDPRPGGQQGRPASRSSRASTSPRRSSRRPRPRSRSDERRDTPSTGVSHLRARCCWIALPPAWAAFTPPPNEGPLTDTAGRLSA